VGIQRKRVNWVLDAANVYLHYLFDLWADVWRMAHYPELGPSGSVYLTLKSNACFR